MGFFLFCKSFVQKLGGHMDPKTRIRLFIIFFVLCLVTYLLVPILIPGRDIVQRLDIFESPITNFIFIISLFLFVAFVFVTLSYAFCCLFRLNKLHKVKIGEILISHGLVTPEQLEEGLNEQRFRMGEILVDCGRITPEQRDQALSYQRKKYRKIGVILKELRYSTEEDILWAIERMKRKIGEILMEKRYITDYDLTAVLSLQAS